MELSSQGSAVAAEVAGISPRGAGTRERDQRLERQVGHLVGLVDDLLDVSRITRGKIALVAVTGYGQPRDRLASGDAGFDAHLVKPVDLEQLAHVVATLTKGRQRRPQPRRSWAVSCTSATRSSRSSVRS